MDYWNTIINILIISLVACCGVGIIAFTCVLCSEYKKRHKKQYNQDTSHNKHDDIQQQPQQIEIVIEKNVINNPIICTEKFTDVPNLDKINIEKQITNNPIINIKDSINTKTLNKDLIYKSPKKRRSNIPKRLKDDVWNTYVGHNKAQSNCGCCGNPFGYNNFDCSHVISDKNGGQQTIENLRPCCASCNRSLGSKNMDNRFISIISMPKLRGNECNHIKLGTKLKSIKCERFKKWNDTYGANNMIGKCQVCGIEICQQTFDVINDTNKYFATYMVVCFKCSKIIKRDNFHVM